MGMGIEKFHNLQLSKFLVDMNKHGETAPHV